MAANDTLVTDLPPLPSYTLKPVTPLLPFIDDFYISLIAPIAAYWVMSLYFHLLDVYDLLPQYRLHTPAEILKRNHVSRYEVARDDVAVWATRIRIAQRFLPTLLGALGLNATLMSKNVMGSYPMLAGALAGGRYPWLTAGLDMSGEIIPAFATWELYLAKAIYYFLIPLFQFFVGIVIVDTWQYFLHRAMHVNKWLYSMYLLIFFPGASLTNTQLPSILDITVCTSHTRTEHCTTTHSKGSFSILLEQA